MRTLPHRALLSLTMLLALACSKQGPKPGPIAAPDRGRAVNTQGDDQGRCDHKNREDREAIETSSPGSLLPNVRRVYQIVSYGDERKRILVCREADTNLDGVKDVIRLYNDKGEVATEEADSDYDGRIDTWLTFTSGRLSKESRDTNNDGNPDLWKYYVLDAEIDASKESLAKAPLRLQRIQRDLNFDTKPDVWEFYEQGRLERMGMDLDYDGRVDRWDHDVVARQAKVDEMQKSQPKAAPSSAPASSAPPPSAPPPDDES
jgi:hypothetical protein